jgi:hypothetical protein
MQDLTLVGLTEDKRKLVLVSDAGEEYTLVVDARLRAALRGDTDRLGQLEIRMESALRPRDIQARIRAGETPENVAAAAQTTVDRIMGFATPVLAERAHIADRAQRASLRRKAGEGPTRLLEDAVTARLRECRVDPQSVEWDAWRREDSRWTLVADYRIDEKPRRAEFLFDTLGRYVVAEDAEARWLVGEESRKQDRRAGAGERRLSPVGGADEQLPLGEDAIDLVSEQPADEVGPDEHTVDLSDTAATVRHRRPAPVDPGVSTGDADWMATQASERPGRRLRSTRGPEPAAEADEESPAREEGPRTAAPQEGAERSAARQEQPETPAPAEPEPAAEPPARRSVKKSRGRASVPSWDEIMFGGRSE